MDRGGRRLLWRRGLGRALGHVSRWRVHGPGLGAQARRPAQTAALTRGPAGASVVAVRAAQRAGAAPMPRLAGSGPARSGSCQGASAGAAAQPRRAGMIARGEVARRGRQASTALARRKAGVAARLAREGSPPVAARAKPLAARRGRGPLRRRGSGAPTSRALARTAPGSLRGRGRAGLAQPHGQADTDADAQVQEAHSPDHAQP